MRQVAFLLTFLAGSATAVAVAAPVPLSQLRTAELKRSERGLHLPDPKVMLLLEGMELLPDKETPVRRGERNRAEASGPRRGLSESESVTD
jgi:hypothetical protein